MPILQNIRHEAFAQGRAKGALLDDAYEDAGFAPENGHASRLAKRPEVAERIAELRVEHAQVGDASVASVIAALLRIAKAGEDLASAAGVKEARLTMLEAFRLSDALATARNFERLDASEDSYL